jgi:hypothetical protein
MITATPPTNSFPRQAALFSVLAPFVSIGITFAGNQAVQGNRTGMMVVGGIGILFILFGFVFGMVALLGTKNHGKEGILGKAIAGTCINGVIILCMLIAIPGFMGAAQRAKEMPERGVAGLTEKETNSFNRIFPDGKLISNPRLGYSFEVPRDFSDNPKAKTSPMIEYAFIRQNSDGTRTAITIENLGGTIGRDSLRPEDAKKMAGQLPPGSEIKLVKGQWSGFAIDGFRSRIAVRGETTSVSAFQVPLAREAVQVNIGGPIKREAESQQIAAMILNSLHGKSNW